MRDLVIGSVAFGIDFTTSLVTEPMKESVWLSPFAFLLERGESKVLGKLAGLVSNEYKEGKYDIVEGALSFLGDVLPLASGFSNIVTIHAMLNIIERLWLVGAIVERVHNYANEKGEAISDVLSEHETTRRVLNAFLAGIIRKKFSKEEGLSTATAAAS